MHLSFHYLILLNSQDGDKFWRMPECYIRGSTIKYLRIPDEVIDMVKEDAQVKSRSRADMKGGRGGGGGQNQRGGRNQGGTGGGGAAAGGGGGRNTFNQRGGRNQGGPGGRQGLGAGGGGLNQQNKKPK